MSKCNNHNLRTNPFSIALLLSRSVSSNILQAGLLDGGGELFLGDPPERLSELLVLVDAVRHGGLRQPAILQVRAAVLLSRVGLI